MKTVDDIEEGYQLHELNQMPSRSQNQNHMGESLETLAQTMSRTVAPPSPLSSSRQSQGVPPELRSLTAEVILILVCSAGFIFFSLLLGDVTVPQEQLKEALGISNSELPWLVGAFNVANGLSVIISGSLMDLTPQKGLMVGAFAWLTIWNIIGIFSIRPKTMVLFFVVRAMQGLAVGVLVSGSMSILGHLYKLGLRKNRVFSAMAATAPLGFWLGAIQGGAFLAHLRWIFTTNAILSALCCVAAVLTTPPLCPVADMVGEEAPTIWQFDLLGAVVVIPGCVCLLFGLTQGSVMKWFPYTYALVAVGICLLALFFFMIECRAVRPLIPHHLWRIRDFTPLMLAYFLGFAI